MTYHGKLELKQDDESTQAWGWVKTKLGEECPSSMENGFIGCQIHKVSVYECIIHISLSYHI